MTTGLLDTTAAIRVCVFALAGEVFALDVAAVREVVTFDDYTVVPLAPTHVIGVANLRGEITPIVDARDLLTLPPRPTGRRFKTLVVAAGALQVALVIDDVLGLETSDEVMPFAETVRKKYGACALGLIRREERLVTLLDAGKVIAVLQPAGARAGAAVSEEE